MPRIPILLNATSFSTPSPFKFILVFHADISPEKVSKKEFEGRQVFFLNSGNIEQLTKLYIEKKDQLMLLSVHLNITCKNETLMKRSLKAVPFTPL